MYPTDAFPQLAPRKLSPEGKFKELLPSNVLLLPCSLTLGPPEPQPRRDCRGTRGERLSLESS